MRKSRDCATYDIGLYAGPDAQFQLNTLSGSNVIPSIILRPESRRREVDLVDLGSPSQIKSFQFQVAAEFANKSHIFIIFDNNMREKICNKTYIVFPTTPNLYAPTLLCNTSGKSD